MYNPIEAKRRFVQGQIHKSFESSINVNDEVGIEKAHKDGDIHPKHPNWVWVSSAAGGKGDWRIAGARTHKKAGASSSSAKTSVDDEEYETLSSVYAAHTDWIDPKTKQEMQSQYQKRVKARYDELKKQKLASRNTEKAVDKVFSEMTIEQLKKELVGKIIKKESKTQGSQTFKVIDIVKYHPYSYSSETKNAIRCKDESGKIITIAPKILNDGKYYADAKYSVAEDNEIETKKPMDKRANKEIPFKDLESIVQVIDYAKTINADFKEIKSDWGGKKSKAFCLSYAGGLKLEIDFVNDSAYTYRFIGTSDNVLYEIHSAVETENTDWSKMLSPKIWAASVKSNLQKSITKHKELQKRYQTAFDRMDMSSDYNSRTSAEKKEIQRLENKMLAEKKEIQRLERENKRVDEILSLSNSN